MEKENAWTPPDRLMEATLALRFYMPQGVNSPKILQQAWRDMREPEYIEWRDVPLVIA